MARYSKTYSSPAQLSLKSIGINAFIKCVELKVVDLPASLSEMQGGAFRACTNLVDVYCRAMTPPNAEQTNIFDEISPDAVLHVPYDALQLYKQASPWWNFKRIVPIEETNGIVTSKVQSSSHPSVFDLQGRRINGEPKRGLYIRDGKKVIK